MIATVDLSPEARAQAIDDEILRRHRMLDRIDKDPSLRAICLWRHRRLGGQAVVDAEADTGDASDVEIVGRAAIRGGDEGAQVGR